MEHSNAHAFQLVDNNIDDDDDFLLMHNIVGDSLFLNLVSAGRKGLHLVPLPQCQIYRTLICQVVICCFCGTSEDGHGAAILAIQRAFVHIIL